MRNLRIAPDACQFLSRRLEAARPMCVRAGIMVWRLDGVPARLDCGGKIREWERGDFFEFSTTGYHLVTCLKLVRTVFKSNEKLHLRLVAPQKRFRTSFNVHFEMFGRWGEVRNREKCSRIFINSHGWRVSQACETPILSLTYERRSPRGRGASAQGAPGDGLEG